MHQIYRPSSLAIKTIWFRNFGEFILISCLLLASLHFSLSQNHSILFPSLGLAFIIGKERGYLGHLANVFAAAIAALIQSWSILDIMTFAFWFGGFNFILISMLLACRVSIFHSRSLLTFAVTSLCVSTCLTALPLSCFLNSTLLNRALEASCAIVIFQALFQETGVLRRTILLGIVSIPLISKIPSIGYLTLLLVILGISLKQQMHHTHNDG